MLVVHPGGGDATTWDGVTRRLTDDFRVVRIRRRIYVPEADIALPTSMAIPLGRTYCLRGRPFD
ncbi:hypothetical protein ABT300_16325 [Streptomyces sp. NPDC001027]|uniref:hypothetical protein n=1 Tax=Streptomyces sp. NPDC001027 TaxID=3154771 RepID=UPI00332F353D